MYYVNVWIVDEIVRILQENNFISCNCSHANLDAHILTRVDRKEMSNYTAI